MHACTHTPFWWLSLKQFTLKFKFCISRSVTCLLLFFNYGFKGLCTVYIPLEVMFHQNTFCHKTQILFPVVEAEYPRLVLNKGIHTDHSFGDWKQWTMAPSVSIHRWPPWLGHNMAKDEKEIQTHRHGISLLYNNPVPSEVTLPSQSAVTSFPGGASSDLRTS